MIWELVVAGGCIHVLRQLYSRDKIDLNKKFTRVLDSTREHVYNAVGETFHISNYKKQEYGNSFEVSIPYGKGYSDFEKLKPMLETNLGYPLEIEQAKGRSAAYVKIIESGFQDKVFEKVETKPWEVFLGYNINGKAIISDQLSHPHIVIGGETGCGKSVMMMEMLVNLVLNHSEKEVNVYITSIAKRDLNNFKYLPQVKGLSKDISDAVKMYREIESIMNKREELFDKNKVKNISQYNKKFKSKIPCVYVFCDELSFYMIQNKDSDSVREQKQIALDLLEDFIKRARAVGIYAVMALQVTNAEAMPLIIRRQSRTHISFLQKEPITSKLIIGTDHATTLNPQEAIVMLDYHEYKIKTPEFDSENIDKYISHLIPKVNVKEEPKETVHILKSEQIPVGMTWQQYLASKNKVIDYSQKIGQFERGKKKKGVLKDVDATR